MQDLFDVVTIPLKKLTNLIFSLSIGNTNLGSIIIVGIVFVALIGAIMHFTAAPNRIGNLIRRFKTDGGKD